MKIDETKIVLTTERYMHGEAKLALDYFVECNPRMQGAKWADALAILLDHDAHNDLTEAIYEDLRPHAPLGMISWIVPVFLTMLYARKGRSPHACEVAYQLGRVEAWLEREEGGDTIE